MASESKRRYDAVLKDLFMQDHPALLDEIVGGVPVRQFLNVEFPTMLEPRADLVLLLDDGSIKHLEFQSDNDPDMVYREGIYGMLIGRMYKKTRVSQVVLYFGLDEMRMDRRVDLGGIQVEYRLMDIREIDSEALMRAGRPGDLALAMLARGGTEKLHRILEQTKSLDPSARNRALTQLALLSGLRRLSDELRLELKAMNSTYIDIQENAILREWFEEAEARGEARGVDYGATQEARKVLGRLIVRRFGSLPKWAEERIGHTEIAQLELYIDRLLNANTLQDVMGPE